MDITHVPVIIIACCMLHNICEIPVSNDAILGSWYMDQPPTADTPEDTTHTSDATIIQDTLVNYYST